MENNEPLLSIGELARRTGLPVRTIRFWSDAGVLFPAARAEGGRRLYDAACADQAELVSTLRDLGLGLADVRRVLAGQASIAEVAAAHRDALDAQIRILQLHPPTRLTRPRSNGSSPRCGHPGTRQDGKESPDEHGERVP